MGSIQVLLVEIRQDGEPVRFVELPDPRFDFARIYNENPVNRLRGRIAVVPGQPISEAIRLASSKRLDA